MQAYNRLFEWVSAKKVKLNINKIEIEWIYSTIYVAQDFYVDDTFPYI